jgi:hypothetical protein
VHVELDAIGAQLGGPNEGGKGVFRALEGCAPVGDDFGFFVRWHA